ncbi:MAG: porin [Gallionellaceae bacterium]|jgi:predicted porin
MSKSNLLNYLIATSLAFSLPAMADTANVSVYGVANVSYDNIDTGKSTSGTQGTNINKASSNASRIGLKGAEELGFGISAIWQIETLVTLDNSSNSCAATTIPKTTIPGHAASSVQAAQTIAAVTVPACTANTGIFATRNSYAGLKSKEYGTVLVGRNDTPYKIITRRLDNFGDTIADNRTLFGTAKGISSSTSFVTKQPDVISYTSPTIAGLVASVAYVNLTETATKASDKKADATSFSVAYDDGSLYAAMGYESHQLDTIRVGGKENAWNAALGYKLDDYSLGLAYEKTSDTLGGGTGCTALANGADCYGHSAMYVTGKIDLDASAIKAAYTKASDLAIGANTGATHVSLGYDYRLTKRSTLYVLYTRLANKSNVNYSLGGAAWSSGSTTSIGSGSTLSAISFGVKQVF